MLKSVEISNFKAFNKTQRAKLKPITLIYGENSVEKSSSEKRQLETNIRCLDDIE